MFESFRKRRNRKPDILDYRVGIFLNSMFSTFFALIYFIDFQIISIFLKIIIPLMFFVTTILLSCDWQFTKRELNKTVG